MSNPAGWYPDPEHPDRQSRWWTGSRWTDDIREGVPAGTGAGTSDGSGTARSEVPATGRTATKEKRPRSRAGNRTTSKEGSSVADAVSRMSSRRKMPDIPWKTVGIVVGVLALLGAAVFGVMAMPGDSPGATPAGTSADPTGGAAAATVGSYPVDHELFSASLVTATVDNDPAALGTFAMAVPDGFDRWDAGDTNDGIARAIGLYDEDDIERFTGTLNNPQHARAVFVSPVGDTDVVTTVEVAQEPEALRPWALLNRSVFAADGAETELLAEIDNRFGGTSEIILRDTSEDWVALRKVSVDSRNDAVWTVTFHTTSDDEALHDALEVLLRSFATPTLDVASPVPRDGDVAEEPAEEAVSDDN